MRPFTVLSNNAYKLPPSQVHPSIWTLFAEPSPFVNVTMWRSAAYGRPNLSANWAPVHTRTEVSEAVSTTVPAHDRFT